jgi:hypothetical protein
VNACHGGPMIAGAETPVVPSLPGAWFNSLLKGSSPPLMRRQYVMPPGKAGASDAAA